MENAPPVAPVERLVSQPFCGVKPHADEFDEAEYRLRQDIEEANGWRVAEAMREIANDVVGSVSLPKSLFCEMDRVRVKFGRDAGHYGTITYVGGDERKSLDARGRNRVVCRPILDRITEKKL